MFSDGHLDETSQPRWINYFTKAQELGLTKETNMTRFQNPVSRYELALILYRFKKIYADEQTPISIVTTGTNTVTDTGSISVNTGTAPVLNNSGDALISLIGGGTSVNDNIEFKETVMWMYDNGLTKFT